MHRHLPNPAGRSGTGQLDNTAQAAGTGLNEEQITDEDSETVSGVQQEESETEDGTDEETDRDTDKDDGATLPDTGAGEAAMMAAFAAILITIGAATLTARRRAHSRSD